MLPKGCEAELQFLSYTQVSKETHRLRDAELESATAALKRVIASRAESVHKRQSAFKSRKLLMLQKRQELAVQHVSLQAQCAVALMRRGLHILAEQLKVRKYLKQRAEVVAALCAPDHICVHELVHNSSY